MTTLTVTQAKARLSELVAAVTTTQDRIRNTRHRKPPAALVSQRELDGLRETIAILSDPATRRDLEDADAVIEAGRTVRAESMREVMVSRRPASA